WKRVCLPARFDGWFMLETFIRREREQAGSRASAPSGDSRNYVCGASTIIALVSSQGSFRNRWTRSVGFWAAIISIPSSPVLQVRQGEIETGSAKNIEFIATTLWRNELYTSTMATPSNLEAPISSTENVLNSIPPQWRLLVTLRLLYAAERMC
ncbi:unnamed protein product, partial [Timema podura]|nr:unnamed protein product [Timema podura]